MGKTKKVSVKKDSKEITGKIRISLKGTGFVRLDTNTTDVEIAFPDLGTALNGDIVKIELLKGKTKFGTPIGKVLGIEKRSKRGFAGELISKKGEFSLKPSDPKMHVYISIPKNMIGDAKIGDKVFVSITKWTDQKKNPLGKVEKVLGKAGEHEAEMQGIILERGFEPNFPNDVELEAKKIKELGINEDEIKARRDFRDTTTFTIDPVDAKDFDDAVSIKKINTGLWEIGIHIADVSFFVKTNSRLDKEALDRATSVYLVDRTIPMLPEILSNDLCSLNPNEDKLVFSAVFEMNENGEVLKEWFGRSIINSDKRFTYEEAQKILDAKEGLFFEELSTLNKIAKNLTKERVKAGAIIMETEEIKFKLDDKGKPIAVFIKERGDTNKLIEELMLLANKRVAMFGSKDETKKDRVFLYRIHDEPNKEKLKSLQEYLKLLGYNLNAHKGSVLPTEFNRLFAELEGKEEKNTIQSTVIRSMQKAIYSTKNLGHYGLAFSFYTHFTSPIRRYPDIVTHRILADYLNGKKVSADQGFLYEKIAIHSTEREIEAAEAERASVKYKQIEYMSERIGEKFDGVITGITEWSIFVAEKTTRTEGVIKLRDLGDGGFSYDVKKMMLQNKNSSKILRIGDTLHIEVVNVDIERQTVDYKTVEK
ncbi:MAG: ribonuclease R [Bacteroidetes bacterium]|nr:ribonuclease R [Bacteroidota bacterium]